MTNLVHFKTKDTLKTRVVHFKSENMYLVQFSKESKYPTILQVFTIFIVLVILMRLLCVNHVKMA